MSKKEVIKPIHEIPETMTIEDVVLKLRTCHRCRGLGMVPGMVMSLEGHLYHPQCYLKKFGFDAVLELPPFEQKKYRLKDLNLSQMRRLLEKLGLKRKPQ